MIHRRIFFTADPHFGHNRIIEYCKRPFKDAHEMNETIIQRYNWLVQDTDVVYFLGDLGFKDSAECASIIKRLKGIKILILGNHDRWGRMSYYNMGFSAVLQEATIEVGKHQVTLAHHPRRSLREFIRICLLDIRKMRQKQRTLKQIIQRIKREWGFYKPISNKWHICGHVHEKWLIRGKNINVGVDQWNFEPVNFNKVLKIIQEK